MRLLNSIILILIFMVLALGNLLITAQRSLIPIELDAKVLGLEMRREKDTSKDNVSLLSLSDQRTMQIDKELAIQIEVGQQIKKRCWHIGIHIHGSTIPLDYSHDFLGMAKAMP